MITAATLDATKRSVDALISQGEALFADISDTVQDRERLLIEAHEREQVVDRLNDEALNLQQRIHELEKRSIRMAEQIVWLEGQLGDATTRLDNVLMVAGARRNEAGPHDGAFDADGEMIEKTEIITTGNVGNSTSLPKAHLSLVDLLKGASAKKQPAQIES